MSRMSAAVVMKPASPTTVEEPHAPEGALHKKLTPWPPLLAGLLRKWGAGVVTGLLPNPPPLPEVATGEGS